MFGDLWFEDYVKIDTDIWFAAGNYNGLYKFDTTNKKLKRIATFPCESIIKDWAFRKVRLWKEQLVFMPAYADAVYLYDIENAAFDKIDFLEEKELIECQAKCKFQCFEIYGDWLYLIGCEYRGIIKVNLTNHQVKKIKNIPEEILAKAEMGQACFGSEVVVENNIIYIACVSSNKILMLDMSDDSFNVIEVGSNRNKYNGICKIENSYYLKTYNSDNIVRWQLENGNCTEIALKFDVHFFDRKLCHTQNYIWVFSYISNEIFRINKNNYKISKVQANCTDDRMTLVFCEEMQDGIYFVNMYDGEWHFIRENGIDENLHFTMKEPDCVTIKKQFFQETKSMVWNKMSENSIATIDLLLLKISESENITKNELYLNYGEKVYAALGSEGIST